jgi:polysaccharide deacetylase family protein (PEP-CTERM system associated)
MGGRRPAPITFTLDLEDHRPPGRAGRRYPAVTRQILGLLGDRGVTGTFFVVGEVAEADPGLVREVAAAGHEVALHGWRHVPLTELDPSGLRADLRRGRSLLEELAGGPVVGFRAPTFSLTAATTWATEVLAEEGFTYSSSVLPTANPLHGFPGAPADPFLWPSGLAELPVPVAGLGPVAVPYLGGTYLRLLPRRLTAAAHARGGRRVPWTYVHPYDADAGERFWVVPDAGWLSPLLWVGRRGVLAKVEALLRDPGPPLRERLAEAAAGGTFHPERPGADRPQAADRSAAGLSQASDRSAADRSVADRSAAGLSQATMVHRLPPARPVDRIAHLTGQARGRRVVHIGFVDTGCRAMQEEAGAWLHGHLAGAATDLVGLDVDAAGVADAVAAGYAAHVADCRDPAALRALGLGRADLVIAGEVIEHLDDPGAFLDGVHELVAPGGRLVVTTPNAYGLLNVLASVARREVNHPDHVVMFTWRTLTNLAARHGWQVVDTHVYVPSVKGAAGAMALGGRLAVGAERALVAAGHRFAADGLIVTFRARP